MIRSMTGFGRASIRSGSFGFDIEVRSVNHRYLDVRVRVPRNLSGLEVEIRACVQDRIDRGKVDLSVVAPDGGLPPAKLEVDLEVARQYARAAEALSKMEGMSGELTTDTLLGLPGVSQLMEPELQIEELGKAVMRGVGEALDALAAMRTSEGVAIERDLLSRLSRVLELSNSLGQRSDAVRESVCERLRKRSEQLRNETGLFDEARLYQEIVIAADRLDITEEIVRLRAHVEQFREIIDSTAKGNPTGRRLDFLLQEMGREANTVGSKGGDAGISREVVDLKTELERIREQVQNVE